jgi:hypothetical protein
MTEVHSPPSRRAVTFQERCAAVTTQNLVRVGADTEIGYLRAKMMNDLLKLQYGLLVLLFRSHAAREAEVALRRQQLLVLKRSVPASAT